MTRTLLGPLLALVLAACGAGASQPPIPTATDEGTGGGETATAAAHPIRTTTPIPLPRRAIPDEQVSAELPRETTSAGVRGAPIPAQRGEWTSSCGDRTSEVAEVLAVESREAPPASTSGIDDPEA